MSSKGDSSEILSQLIKKVLETRSDIEENRNIVHNALLDLFNNTRMINIISNIPSFQDKKRSVESEECRLQRIIELIALIDRSIEFVIDPGMHGLNMCTPWKLLDPAFDPHTFPDGGFPSQM